jgi:hypothetical protein
MLLSLMNLLDQIPLVQELEVKSGSYLIVLWCYFVELINNHFHHLVVLKFKKIISKKRKFHTLSNGVLVQVFLVSNNNNQRLAN